MKISELTKINKAEPDAVLPVSLSGETLGISLGTVIDAVDNSVVMFQGISAASGNVTVQEGSDSLDKGAAEVVFNTSLGGFYVAEGNDTDGWLYYRNWNRRSHYYSGSSVRTDCVFVANDGRQYVYNGTTLISSGVTQTQAEAIEKSTPIEMASEEAMQALIASGGAVEGQIYYIVES